MGAIAVSIAVQRGLWIEALPAAAKGIDGALGSLGASLAGIVTLVGFVALTWGRRARVFGSGLLVIGLGVIGLLASQTA